MSFIRRVLLRKDCISEVAQCYHFLFEVEGRDSFRYQPGQFVSAVAPDENGKQQTRAYSIASAANGNQFELCVNRVENGFFSNHLADLPDLPVGSTIQIHGPHGHFVLQEPITDSIFVATGTGVAPMRAYSQWLFPELTAPTAARARRSGWSTGRGTKPTSITRMSSRRWPSACQTSTTCPR